MKSSPTERTNQGKAKPQQEEGGLILIIPWSYFILAGFIIAGIIIGKLIVAAMGVGQ